MGNIEFIPIQLEHASGKSMWLLKNCTVPLSPSVTPYLQFSIFNSSPSHPGWPLPTILHLFSPKGCFLLKETQCPHWPPLVPVVSSSLVRFQCCVAASDGEERQNLEIKGHHKAIEATSWSGIRFCRKKRDDTMLPRQYEKYETKIFVYLYIYIYMQCLNRLYSHVKNICIEML